MQLIRKIGRHEVMIETAEPLGIYLGSTALELGPTGNEVTLERREILDLLANGDEYLPLTLHWEMWDRCNFSCPFCYIVGHSFNRTVRFAEIENHLSDLVQEGLLFCTLTGGESTIHPDFRAIYSFLKEKGVLVEVFTNGHAVDEELIALFQRLPPASVEISLYTLSDARLQSVYGVKDQAGASKVLANVRRLKAAGINVVCKTFLNTVTQADVAAIQRWCLQEDIRHYTSSDFTPAYDGDDITEFALSRPEEGPSKFPRKKSVCLPCKTKNYGSAITSAFNIYPCPSIKLPECTFDLRALGVAEALRRMKAFMRRFQDAEIQGSSCGPKGCANCMAYAKPVRNEAGELLYFSHG